MKKIFFVTGELSGDKLGAWYIRTLREAGEQIEAFGVGGDFLAKEGVALYERMEKLNIVGILEVVKKLRFIFKFLRKLVKHILEQNVDEVVVVDFPGFNLRLIKKLKKIRPDLKITYLSPPQLWVWGASRVHLLRKFCDDVIVLYPFEVEWYQKRQVSARWIGYPHLKTLAPYALESKKIQKNMVILPGSRDSEIKRLLPIFIRVIRRFRLAHSNIKVFLPLAESVNVDMVEKIMRSAGPWGQDIVIVRGEAEKLKRLSTCSFALTKPGTVTLELAMLGIPAVVAYKASWITYFLAKMVVRVKWMALPNLLLSESLYPELIQSDCTTEKILRELERLYISCSENNEEHQILYKKFDALQKMLS